MIDLIGNKLCQWETDRRIKISNKEIVKLVFGSEQHCDGCPVDVVNGEVVIPDHLLQSPVAIEVYGVNAKGEEIYSCKFAVNSRRKPAGYCVPASGPDWNQNDPSAKDYIKNRPFWVEKEKIAIFENEEVENRTNEHNPSWFFEATNSMILPSDGDKVVVVNNNVEHELVLRWNEDTEYFGTQTPDGQYRVFVYDDGTGEINWGLISQEPVTASLYVVRETVHKIPEKYLPSGASGITRINVYHTVTPSAADVLYVIIDDKLFDCSTIRDGLIVNEELYDIFYNNKNNIFSSFIYFNDVLVGYGPVAVELSEQHLVLLLANGNQLPLTK